MLPHRKIAAAAIAVLLALAFTVVRPPGSAGPPERDFEAYYSAGATVDAGGDPYSRAVWSAERRIPGVDGARDELLPFVGPAAGLPLWALLARLPYRGAVIVWTLLLAGALATLLVAALRIAGAPPDPWVVLFAAAAGCASAPLTGSLALGQTSLVAAAAIAAAAVAYRARRPAGAFAATLLAGLQPNLAIALAARIRSRWDAAVAGAAAAVFAAVTLAAGGGLPGWRAYLGHLAAHGRAEADITIQHTPAAIAYAFGLAPAAAAAAGACVAVLAVVLAAGTIVRERLEPTDATLLTCTVLPLAIPFFHEQDFAIVFVPVLVLAVRARGNARRLALAGASLVLVDWFGLAQRPNAALQILCLGGVVAAALAAIGKRSALRPPDLTGAYTLVAAGALALPLAWAHPAPTWPEMLPARYHAPPAADASAVWAGEARATGLDRRDPVWGLLRGLPLTGCALLAGALALDARARRRRARYAGRTRSANPQRKDRDVAAHA